MGGRQREFVLVFLIFGASGIHLGFYGVRVKICFLWEARRTLESNVMGLRIKKGHVL